MNIILLIITIAQGKINIAGYLTYIIFGRTFFLLLLDYAMKSGEQLSYWLFGYNLIC